MTDDEEDEIISTPPPHTRPSIIVCIPSRRLGKTLQDRLQTQIKNQTSTLSKKPRVKRECWITNMGKSVGGGRKRKISEKVDTMGSKRLKSEEEEVPVL